MRILMVIQIGLNTNPYVSSLADGLVKCGHDVKCNLDLFWNSFSDFDLLYFQWPEAIFEGRKEKIDLEKLSMHLNHIKETGVKMVITCHNLHPHNNDTKTTDLYNLVYSKVDAFHHMGKKSYNLLKEKYPHQYHFIAPHHIADGLWDYPIGQSDARRKLHISNNNIVISSFGAFRNEEEVRLFVDMAHDVSSWHLTFLAPRIPMERFYHGRHIGRSLLSLYKRLKYKMIGIKYSGYLTEDELKDWLSASDIVFIQRIEILNSGNLPLAFSAKKIVVGPDVGNVGEILNETGNYVFNPNDRSSVRQSVLNAVNDMRNSNLLGIQNYHYARNNWSVSTVCGLIDKELAIIRRNQVVEYK